MGVVCTRHDYEPDAERVTGGGLFLRPRAMLRFGQLSADEYLVGEPAARGGVRIHNASPS